MGRDIVEIKTMYSKSLFTFLLYMLVFTDVNAQDFRVQLAAYIQEIPTSRFEEKGVSGVYMQPDQNEIYRYFVGHYDTYRDAAIARDSYAALGFPNAKVIDVDEQKALCGIPCPYITSSHTYVDEGTEGLSIWIIFFDFDRSKLKPESKATLHEFTRILEENPNYSASLMAHTDAKGSAQYNLSLSKRRGRSARNYIIAQGISARRLNTKVFGESKPIAKNYAFGKEDSPTGRKYNRRVVMTMVDEKGEVVSSSLVGTLGIPELLMFEGK